MVRVHRPREHGSHILRAKGFASIRRVYGDYDSPETVGTVFRQNDSIGLDSFGGTYTIRAFNAWEKDRYETVTFTVIEAE